MFILNLILASLISSYGLIMNSQETVIGSMILSPLLSPLIAMCNSNCNQFDEISKIIIGICISLLVSYVISNISTYTETKQMENKTEISKYSHLIPIVSGIILYIASLDKFKTINSWSLLIGISIAISVLPPLCASGLYLKINKEKSKQAFKLGLLNIILIVSTFIGMNIIFGESK